MKNFLLYTIAVFALFYDTATIAQTISGIVNQYAQVTAVTNTSITVNNTSGFSTGDLAVIIQMDGNPLTPAGANAGNYEYTFINNISGNTLTVPPMSRNYSPTTNKVQLIKVPNYTDVTVSGELSCQPYNSQNGTGGVIALYVCGTLTLEADINVSAKGFRGANTHESATPAPAPNDVISQGQGISPFFVTTILTGNASPAGGVGGGGGMTYTNGSPDLGGFGGGGGGGVGGGGGGGGMFGGGGTAGKGGLPLFTSGATAGQNGESATGNGYFDADTNKVFMGGGGGYEAHKVPYGSAGNGGGIILIVAAEIVGNGHAIRAEGGGSFHACNNYNDADHFGGGGGGQMLIHTPNIIGNLTLSAKGGNSNSCQNEYGGGGGGGGIWTSIILPGGVSTNVSGGLSPNIVPVPTTVGFQQKGGNGLVIMNTLDLAIAGACSCPPTDCDDGLCFTVDSVNPLSCDCMHIPAVFNCNDNDCATLDSVDPVTCECTHTPVPFECNDNDCMTTDVVNPNNCSCTHVPIEIPDCDDQLCSTTDSFNQNNCQCEHTPIVINCDDGLCTTDDSLDETTCECIHTPIAIPDCNDNDCNTADVYNQMTCECENNPLSPTACDDGLCQTTDTYNTTTCECEHTPIAEPNCDDNNCNTTDSYNMTTCACVHAVITPPDCSDNDPQTVDYYNESTCACENLAKTAMIIPNAFSPNDDDINDIFRVFTNEPNITEFSLEVYNRWGQKVFVTSNITDGWDGRWKGIDQEMGVYVYQLRYTRPINGSRLLHGNVTLVR
jgi:gliding motility-associated-like protein